MISTSHPQNLHSHYFVDPSTEDHFRCHEEAFAKIFVNLDTVPVSGCGRQVGVEFFKRSRVFSIVRTLGRPLKVRVKLIL